MKWPVSRTAYEAALTDRDYWHRLAEGLLEKYHALKVSGASIPEPKPQPAPVPTLPLMVETAIDEAAAGNVALKRYLTGRAWLRLHRGESADDVARILRDGEAE